MGMSFGGRAVSVRQTPPEAVLPVPLITDMEGPRDADWVCSVAYLCNYRLFRPCEQHGTLQASDIYMGPSAPRSRIDIARHPTEVW